MGTRADFYTGVGQKAEWLGSIAWDGYPSGLPKNILKATDKIEYVNAVALFIESRGDATQPAYGWPWPWENSCTTDYAYTFRKGGVWASCFGSKWFDPLKSEPENMKSGVTSFPDMTKIQRVNFGRRSGLIVLTAEGDGKISINQ